MSPQTDGALDPEGRFYLESAAHPAGRGAFEGGRFERIILDEDSAQSGAATAAAPAAAAAAAAAGFLVEDAAVALAAVRPLPARHFLLPHRIDFEGQGRERGAGRVVPLDGARSRGAQAGRYVGPLDHGFQRMQRFRMLPDGREGTLTGREGAGITEGTASVAPFESALFQIIQTFQFHSIQFHSIQFH